MAEDSRGQIYVGNEAGVLHFDGRDWSLLPPTGHELLTVAVHLDAKDRIWVGGADHLGYYETSAHGRLEFKDLTNELKLLLEGEEHGMIWSIFSDKHCHYIVTNYHVLIRDAIGWHRHDFNADRRILPTWLDGRLYIHDRGNGLYRLKGKEIEKILPGHESISSGIITVLSDDQDKLRLGTIANGTWNAQDGILKKETPYYSPSHLVFSYIKLNEGRLLIGRTNGLCILKKDGDEVRINQNKITSAQRLFKSSNGSIWITSATSIYRVPPSSYTRYSYKAEYLERHQGDMYLLSESSIYRLNQGEKIAEGWLSNPLSRGPYLIYTKDKFIHANRNGRRDLSAPLKRPSYLIHKSLWHEDVFYTIDEPGISRWMANERGLIPLSQTGESKKIFASLAGVGDGVSLCATSDGEIGLIHWPDGHGQEMDPNVKILKLDPDLPQPFHYIKAIQFGKRALLATGQGLFAFDPAERNFTRLNVLKGMLGRTWSDFVHCQSSDRKGLVVYIEDKNSIRGYRLGILRYEEQTGFTWKPLELAGLAEVGAVRSLLHEKKEGREYLWIGGSKDLFRYDITVPSYPPVPRVNLTSIKEASEGTTHYGGFGPLPISSSLPYPQKSLQIGYAAPPAALEAKGYQTRLIGLSDQWSELTGLPLREFNNLSEGDYTFEVRAIDEFGRSGPSSSFAFTILPPWYRTPYAYLGYIALGICVLLIVARLWTLHLRQRNLELEALVNQRTSELERKNQQLREANSVKQNFLASMSHEIRNPLNGILGIAQLLKQEQEEDTRRVSYLNACAKHLHQLLGQVLDFSSLESGKLETRSAPFDPAQLIEDVIGMHQVLAEKKGLHLKTRIQKTDRFWIGDPVLLRQVLINLVSNAIKYTPKGEVRVQLDYENRNESLRAKFTVEDTGPGIPEDKRDFIFRDFTRLTRAGESEVAGTGLGLAIASQMAELMHGTLRLDDDYAEGARFVLELPFDKGGKLLSIKDTAERSDSQPLLAKRVLVADDMDFNRYICRELLEKLGAEVTEAEDGQIVLQALNEGSYAIAILDINMPKMDGNQVVRHFLDSHVGTPPLFIALTAHVTAHMEQAALEAGFQQFIEKPLDQDQIIQIALAQPLRDKLAHKPDLLSYLAGSNQHSKSKLQARYLKSMREQIEALQACITGQDREAAKAVLHKLRGLVNMRRTTDVTDLIEQLSDYLASDGDPDSALEKVRQLEALLKAD